MASPHPPHVDAALAHLRQSLSRAGDASLDLGQASWADIEKGVIKVLGGPFVEARPEHQAVALGLSGVLADRLVQAHKAFWFPNREAPEGAMLGFAEALILLSPYSAVADALGRANLGQLEQTVGQIRQALGQAKFAPQSASSAPVRLSPGDYQRLFDPGFVQLIRLDPQKAQEAWNATPERLIRDVREALSRTGEQLPTQAKSQLEGQLVGALSRLDAQKPLVAQAEVAPRLLEMLGHLWGTVESTGAAPEEFWQDVVFPLAFIGAPEQFPPVGTDEKEAVAAGADPLALWVDLVPHRFPAPDEGLLGAFEPDDVKVLIPAAAQAEVPRLLQVGAKALESALKAFDPGAVRQALGKFQAALAPVGGTPPPLAPESEQMLEAVTVLLGDTRRLLNNASDGKSVLCVRRITEAEAASELTLAALRKALNGPRLILTAR